MRPALIWLALKTRPGQNPSIARSAGFSFLGFAGNRKNYKPEMWNFKKLAERPYEPSAETHLGTPRGWDPAAG